MRVDVDLTSVWEPPRRRRTPAKRGELGRLVPAMGHRWCELDESGDPPCVRCGRTWCQHRREPAPCRSEGET